MLTAGHCTDLKVPLNREFPTLESIIRVYFGQTNMGNVSRYFGTAYERRVAKVHKHPDYDPGTLWDDLAVLELDRPVSQSQTSDYICLYNFGKDDSVLTGMKLYTAGWGSIKPEANKLLYPDNSYYVDLIVRPMDACKYIDPLQYLFNPITHVCAGYDKTVGKDTCFGDSGAPLMVQLKKQWFIYGKIKKNLSNINEIL